MLYVLYVMCKICIVHSFVHFVCLCFAGKNISFIGRGIFIGIYLDWIGISLFSFLFVGHDCGRVPQLVEIVPLFSHLYSLYHSIV